MYDGDEGQQQEEKAGKDEDEGEEEEEGNGAWDIETAYPAVQPLVLNVLQDIDPLKPASATLLGLEKEHCQHKYKDMDGGVTTSLLQSQRRR